MVLDSDVTLESAGACSAIVLADEDALTQVFGNLIENAMKYGKSGKRVLVGGREMDGYVEFSVQDFGPGIGSEHLSRIFERFYRTRTGHRQAHRSCPRRYDPRRKRTGLRIDFSVHAAAGIGCRADCGERLVGEPNPS
jgi:signal transduction histidine kinase